MPFERWLHFLSLPWRSLFRRRHVDGDLDDEIRHHVERAVEEHVAKGMDEATARHLVVRQLGGVDRVKERCRDARGTALADTIVLDVRYALRTSVATGLHRRRRRDARTGHRRQRRGVQCRRRHSPSRPAVRRCRSTRQRDPGRFPGGAFAAMRDEVRSLDVAAYAEGHAFTLSGDGEPLRIRGTLISAELMPLLASSRRSDDGCGGDDPVPRDRFVILSHGLWTSRFGRIRHCRPLRPDRWHFREVVAVMPPAFEFPSSRTEVWIPIGLDPRDTPRYWAGDFMPVIGRVREGVTRAQVQIDLRAFQTRVRGLFPWPMPDSWNRDVGTVTLQEAIVGGLRPRPLILVAAVAVLLLIACANVGTLSLSRAAS